MKRLVPILVLLFMLVPTGLDGAFAAACNDELCEILENGEPPDAGTLVLQLVAPGGSPLSISPFRIYLEPPNPPPIYTPPLLVAGTTDLQGRFSINVWDQLTLLAATNRTQGPPSTEGLQGEAPEAPAMEPDWPPPLDDPAPDDLVPDPASVPTAGAVATDAMRYGRIDVRVRAIQPGPNYAVNYGAVLTPAEGYSAVVTAQFNTGSITPRPSPDGWLDAGVHICVAAPDPDGSQPPMTVDPSVTDATVTPDPGLVGCLPQDVEIPPPVPPLPCTVRIHPPPPVECDISSTTGSTLSVAEQISSFQEAAASSSCNPCLVDTMYRRVPIAEQHISQGMLGTIEMSNSRDTQSQWIAKLELEPWKIAGWMSEAKERGTGSRHVKEHSGPFHYVRLADYQFAKWHTVHRGCMPNPPSGCVFYDYEEWEWRIHQFTGKIGHGSTSLGVAPLTNFRFRLGAGFERYTYDNKTFDNGFNILGLGLDSKSGYTQQTSLAWLPEKGCKKPNHRYLYGQTNWPMYTEVVHAMCE